jgi:hypothetical protein
LCWTKFIDVYKNHCICSKIKAILNTLQSVIDTSIEIAIGIDNSNSLKKEDSKGENKKKFIPPTFQEFLDYCKENGFENIADRAFKGYEAGNWNDSQEHPVKNWKQKLQHVWFREDNKKKESFSNPYQKIQ